MAEHNLTRADAVRLVEYIVSDGLDTIYEDAHQYVDEKVCGSNFDYDELDDISAALAAEAVAIIENILKALGRWEF